MLLFGQVGFPLLVSLYRFIKDKIYGKKVISEEILDATLADKKLRKMFTDFIRSEWLE